MARISIDDELFNYKPFKNLLKKFKGDEDRAIGMVYRFWKLAQDHWGNDCALMPPEEFEEEGFQVLLEVRMAEVRPEGIYAHGAKERFAWYLQRCRASSEGVKARAANREKASGPPKSPPSVDRDKPSGPPKPDSGSTGNESRSTETDPPVDRKPDSEQPTASLPLRTAPAPASVIATVSAPAAGPSIRVVDNSARAPDKSGAGPGLACALCSGSGTLRRIKPPDTMPMTFRCSCPIGLRAGPDRSPRWGPEHEAEWKRYGPAEGAA